MDTYRERPFTAAVIDDGCVVVRLEKTHINLSYAESVRDQLKDRILSEHEKGATLMLLDLTGVASVDSCGVGLIIGTCTYAASIGMQSGITGVGRTLDRVFKVMRLRKHFRIFVSPAEALAARG